MNVFLEIKNIKKHFGEGESRVEVLKGIDIEIEKGEFCVLLGPSGSGKSTLLNIIGGIDAADEGYITNVAVFPPYRRRGAAGKLLDVFLRFARANHLAFLTLEVRPSNAAAIALYTRFGFREAGRRRNYYDLPKEDALILTRTFEEDDQ